MSAEYAHSKISVAPETRLGQAEFAIRNTGSETWPSGGDFAFGAQVFDAETGTMIVDGPRVKPECDVAPGGETRVRLAFELPPEDGGYQVIISPMREGVCWMYERGWRFLLVEASVRGGAARLSHAGVSSQNSLRRRRALRSVGRAFTYPLATIWRNRGLIRAMVKRDIQGRYRGSFGGALWTIMNPLLLMLTYFFVFGVVLNARFEGAPGRSGFALYFLAGMLPWLAFSEAVARAPSVVAEHRNFVKKLVFAVETLPVNLVISGLVSQFFALLLFGLALLVIRGSAPASVLWLPALLIPQLLFTAGVVWFLAALGVFVRDLGQVIGFALTVLFFLTPICYPEAALNSLPDFATLLLTKNPVYVLVRGYRAVLLENHAPDFSPLWKLWLLSGAVFILGHAWFYKLRKSFADIV